MVTPIVTELVSETLQALNPSSSIAIIGSTPIALDVRSQLLSRVPTLPIHFFSGESPTTFSKPMSELRNDESDILVIAADGDKELFLQRAVPLIKGLPSVILAGYDHFAATKALLVEEQSQLLVPSLANGYPNTLTHIVQCLENASRLGLQGAVVEFGMFKGGTTMLMSRVIERLGMSWPVIGFDTFNGFPPRRSILDMYNHPGCIFTDEAAVRRQFEGRNVEIIAGDIVETCHRLDTEDIVLAFLDTDNFSPATAALEVICNRIVVGGAIVLDHFTGIDRFKYTLGERMAALPLLEDHRYFNLHQTGVFFRQR